MNDILIGLIFGINFFLFIGCCIAIWYFMLYPILSSTFRRKKINRIREILRSNKDFEVWFSMLKKEGLLNDVWVKKAQEQNIKETKQNANKQISTKESNRRTSASSSADGPNNGAARVRESSYYTERFRNIGCRTAE